MKMIYNNIICVLIIISTISFNSFSQDTEISKDSINYSVLAEKLLGTYQIQMIDTRSLPSFPAELLIIIEEKREDDSIVYHKVSDTMRIKILSKLTINAENFEPVERITYISSKDL
jgi:hypothetical protein